MNKDGFTIKEKLECEFQDLLKEVVTNSRNNRPYKPQLKKLKGMLVFLPGMKKVLQQSLTQNKLSDTN